MAGILPSESNAPSTAKILPVAPIKFREVLQNQIDTTVARRIDEAMKTSGMQDGRYLMGVPTEKLLLSDDYGNYYHVVGSNITGDGSVAGP